MTFDAAIFGLIVADLIAEPMDLRSPPAPGGLHKINSLTLTTGGNVCNTGVAMAKLGMKVAAAGLVGNDTLGSAVLEKLKQSKLDTSAIFRTEQAQTSATVVAVEPGGERCFFHTPGATTLLDGKAFRKCFDLFKQCRWVQIGYFGLLSNTFFEELPALLKELRAAAPETKIALDTVNPPGDWKLLHPILPHVQLFAPSRAEASALTGESDPKKMIQRIRGAMGKEGMVAIKLDSEGCMIDTSAGNWKVPAYKVDVVDTTGAGDVWFGGLLTGLMKEMPPEKAGKFANRAAADCCTAIGASAGVKNFEETLARI